MRRPALQRAAETDFRLYHVTDSALSGGIDAVPAVVRAAVRGGAGVIQLRDKQADDLEFLELVRECRAAVAAELGRTAAAGIPLVVNDRLAVAAETGCHLHLGQSDIPVHEARAALGEELMIGLSTSTPQLVEAALAEGTADVLGIGPLRATPTKADAGRALGIAGLTACLRPWREARAAGRAVPATVAIGGIGPDNAADIAATGVDGLCVVSAIAAAEDPATAARELRTAIADGRGRNS